MKKLFACLMAALMIFSGGCAPQKHRTEFFAMDTLMSVTLYGKNSSVASACEKEAYRLEKLLSATLSDSEISAIRNGQAPGEETYSLISEALYWAEETGGAFDPTALPLSIAWGFLSDEQRVPTEAELSEALVSVGYDKVKAENGMILLPEGGGIDLGGIAKGYAARRMREILIENGMESAMVYLGGNIQLIGSAEGGKDWRVAVQDPVGEDYAVILQLSDMCIATSGAYQRYFEEAGKRYHHIMDVSTGYPAESGIASVTVVCSDGVMADALSTALFVMGEEKAAELWRSRGDFEMVIITEDGRLLLSEGLAEKCEKQTYEIEIIHSER